MAYKISKVLVDYGHGGMINGKYQTTSAKRYTFTDQKPPLTIYEGVFNRTVAAKLIELLLKDNLEVHDVVARKKVEQTFSGDWKDLEQKDVSLTDRIKYANKFKSNSFLISIHGNAIGNTLEGLSQNARGLMVFTSPGKTQSDAIADAIALEFDAIVSTFTAASPSKVRRETVDGDADYERDFYVTRESLMPAVLSENGFFTNLEDAKIMLSDDGVEKIAKAHYKAIKKFC